MKINSIAKGENAAIYNFSASLKPEKAPYQLMNNWENAKYWHIASEMFPGHFMPALMIEFPSAVKNLSNEGIEIYPQPASNYFSFKYSQNVENIIIFDVKGRIVNQIKQQRNEGIVNTEKLSSGLYFLRFETTSGYLNRRLLINK